MSYMLVKWIKSGYLILVTNNSRLINSVPKLLVEPFCVCVCVILRFELCLTLATP
jgi:hypothetical protein